ncbi:MAG: glycosyltransferase family 87 protein [Phycisphaerae bacterium]
MSLSRTIPDLIPARRSLALLTRDRLWRYPPLLLLATIAVYALTLARARPIDTSLGAASGASNAGTIYVEPDGRVVGHDFLAFFMAGDFVARGRANELYDLAAQSTYQKSLMAGANPNWAGTCLYLNPPHYALAVSWLSRLGYGGALVAWWLLSLAAFGATAWIWKSWLPRERFALVITLVICSPPFFQALAGGQNSLFSLLILSGAASLLLRGRDLSAGLVLSLLAFKFQLLIVPLILLVWLRRLWTITGVVVGLLGTILLSDVWLGDDVWPRYFAFASGLGELMQLSGFDVAKQHSWHGFFSLLLANRAPLVWIRILTGAASIATVMVALRACRGGKRENRASLAISLSAMILAALLVSPHLFHYDMLLAALPAVLLVRRESVHDSEAAEGALVPALLFVWLAIAPLTASWLPLQLTPLIMFAWLFRVSSCGAGAPDARPPAVAVRAV